MPSSLYLGMHEKRLYNDIVKTGREEMRKCRKKGINPHVRCLEELLSKIEYREVSKPRYVHVPTDCIVGLYGTDRKNSFSRGLYPVVEYCKKGDPFPSNWLMALRHLDENIERQKMMRAYEFLGGFYFSYGAKTASAAKIFGKKMVYAEVLKLSPKRLEKQEIIDMFPAFFCETPSRRNYSNVLKDFLRKISSKS